jgi:GTP pyrophosphokinase
MSQTDYALLRNGTLNGQDSEMLLDEENLDSLEEDLIKVYTRSGEIKYIPKGSTVLDFAFKIHKDIGFGFIYAVVNNSKTKCPPYTKVYEGDKIEIVVEKDNIGEVINRAELKWLAYVNTEFAKKNLIKYFERKIIN